AKITRVAHVLFRQGVLVVLRIVMPARAARVRREAVPVLMNMNGVLLVRREAFKAADHLDGIPFLHETHLAAALVARRGREDGGGGGVGARALHHGRDKRACREDEAQKAKLLFHKFGKLCCSWLLIQRLMSQVSQKHKRPKAMNP